MNVELRKLQESLVDSLNQARLPIEAKRLVVCEILHKLEEQANKEIVYEIQEMNKQSEKEEQGE